MWHSDHYLDHTLSQRACCGITVWLRSEIGVISNCLTLSFCPSIIVANMKRIDSWLKRSLVICQFHEKKTRLWLCLHSDLQTQNWFKICVIKYWNFRRQWVPFPLNMHVCSLAVVTDVRTRGGAGSSLESRGRRTHVGRAGWKWTCKWSNGPLV